MTPGRSPDVLEQAQAKACCADLYRSELARIILGETLHPGGLALTNCLARLMGVQPGDWVVDLASGRGASAMAVSQVFRCNVVGVEFGRSAVAEAQAKAEAQPSMPQEQALETTPAPKAKGSYFIQGDAERPPRACSWTSPKRWQMPWDCCAPAANSA